MTGSCLYGAVTIEIAQMLDHPDDFHCGHCRKWLEYACASESVAPDNLTVRGGDKISWDPPSDKVWHAFRSTCRSSLFRDRLTGPDWTSVAMDMADAPTGTHLAKHIFTADKGDYYDIADSLPQQGVLSC